MSLSDRLKPVSAAVGNQHLSACLVLVAPSGMTAEEREQWLKAARMTLRGIPEDLLERGCRKARETCRFPSEIVPTIMASARKTWEARKAEMREQPTANDDEPSDPWVGEQMKKLLSRFKA